MRIGMKNSFYEEIEKIAKMNERKQQALDAVRAALAVGTGAGTAYLSERGLSSIKKAPTPRARAVISGLLAGTSAIMTNKAIKDYLDGNKKSRNRRKRNRNKNLLSSQQQSSVGHKGHSSEVPSPLLQSAEPEAVPVFTGRGPIFRGDERDGDGDNNNRLGDDRYRYSRKKTRNYRFKDPF